MKNKGIYLFSLSKIDVGGNYLVIWRYYYISYIIQTLGISY